MQQYLHHLIPYMKLKKHSSRKQKQKQNKKQTKKTPTTTNS